MKKIKIRVVTYLRTSSTNNKDVLNKEIEMNKLLEEHKEDWEVVAQFEDIGCGGRRLEREGLSNLFEKLDSVNMVVSLSSEMIAKDVLVYKDIYHKIISHNCSLYIRDVHRSNIPKKKFKNLDLLTVFGI